MLTACQSLKQAVLPTAPTQGVVPDSARAMFEDSQLSSASIAKAQVLTALEAHLGAEQYAISTHYYQTTPLYGKDSLDKEADSIWTSVIKTNEYRNHQSYQNTTKAYRTVSEYLYDENQTSESDLAIPLGEDLGKLPYLRYDDEKNDTTPKTVTRSIGMGDEYQEVSSSIEELDSLAKDCVDTAHRTLGAQIDTNPALNDKHPSVKETKQKLNQCRSELQTKSKKLLTKAKGYQVSDIKQLRQCLTQYQTGLGELMRPSRTPLNLTGNQAGHEALYANHQLCALSLKINEGLSPYHYTKYQASQAYLDNTIAIKACHTQALDAQANLRRQGKTYQHHAHEFLQTHHQFLSCGQEAIGNDDEPVKSTDEAMVKFYEVQSYLSEYGREYDDYRKYWGLSGWLKAYREMKNSNTTETDQDEDEDMPTGVFGIYDNMVKSLLNHLKRTPEQLHAQNIYQYDYTTLTSLWHHNPAQRQVSLLWSLDFKSPTATQSAQLPVQVNFNEGVVNADVSVALPIVAAVSPTHALLPKDVDDGKMFFKLPNELHQKLPTSVIYDALIRGILLGVKELNAEKFTPVDKTGDKFAQQIGASTVVKVEFGSKELGKIYGTMIKSVAKDLSAYVDNNPALYPDTIATKNDKAKGIKKGQSVADKLKEDIQDFATLSSAHRASDVGGLLQIIEGIVPFDLDNVSYVYFDKAGKLIGTQSVGSVDSDVHDTRLQTVIQTHYGKGVFERHALAGQFAQSFATTPKFDGKAWLKDSIETYWDEYEFARQAKEAREGYEAPSYDQLKSTTSCRDVAVLPHMGNEDAQKTQQAFQEKECNTK